MTRWVLVLFLALVAAVAGAAAFLLPSADGRSGTTQAQVGGRAPGADRQLPLKAAFYYPWFPETERWATHYSPVLGRYDSSDAEILAAHVAQARYAGLDAFISSWMNGRSSAARLPLLLDAAAAQEFAVAAYYEREGPDDPSVAQIQADLEAIPEDHAAYLHVSGKPVLFVSNANDSDCSVIDRWQQAAPGWYLSMKVFQGFSSCPSQPDSWHQYGPDTEYSTHGRYHATVSPGFWNFSEPGPRLDRDPARFRADLIRAAEAGVDWQLVATFNDWGDGTSVEPAREWASASGNGRYLDVMHEVFVQERHSVAPPSRGPPISAAPPPGRSDDVVVMAAGDIACDPAGGSQAAAGNGTRTCAHNRVAQQILAVGPHAALTLGDNQYEEGAIEQYRDSYDVTWGPLKPITYPAPGNHEWLTSDAKGYRDYFDTGTPPEVDEQRGYYSFDIGVWHFISFDSDCSEVGGCAPGSDMYGWFRADLGAHDGHPTLVFWHHPRWSSGEHGSLSTPIGPMWDLMVADRDVQVALSGHDHDYERFAPMGSAGPEPGGVRQFVAGTGGKNHRCPVSRIAGSEAADCTSFGALRLTLHPDGSYDWYFTAAPETGSYTDQGSQARR